MDLPTAREAFAAAGIAARWIGKLFGRVTRLTDTQDKHTELLARQAEKIDMLRSAVTRLEAREAMLLVKVEAAASLATADLARRIGCLEERNSQ